jgi:hypothetical protein
LLASQRRVFLLQGRQNLDLASQFEANPRSLRYFRYRQSDHQSDRNGRWHSRICSMAVV